LKLTMYKWIGWKTILPYRSHKMSGKNLSMLQYWL
jgi:hypothetical protein